MVDSLFSSFFFFCSYACGWLYITPLFSFSFCYDDKRFEGHEARQCATMHDV